LLLHGGQKRQLIVEKAEAIARLGLVRLEQQFLAVKADGAVLPRHGPALRVGRRPYDQLVALDPAALYDLAVPIKVVRRGYADDLAVGRLVGAHGPPLLDDALVTFQAQVHELTGAIDFFSVAYKLL